MFNTKEKILKRIERIADVHTRKDDFNIMIDSFFCTNKDYPAFEYDRLSQCAYKDEYGNIWPLTVKASYLVLYVLYKSFINTDEFKRSLSEAVYDTLEAKGLKKTDENISSFTSIIAPDGIFPFSYFINEKLFNEYLSETGKGSVILGDDNRYDTEDKRAEFISRNGITDFNRVLDDLNTTVEGYERKEGKGNVEWKIDIPVEYPLPAETKEKIAECVKNGSNSGTCDNVRWMINVVMDKSTPDLFDYISLDISPLLSRLVAENISSSGERLSGAFPLSDEDYRKLEKIVS